MNSPALQFAPLRLRKHEARRLRQGHAWVFSNEIDTRCTPLQAFEPGAAVTIEDDRGKVLGTGYVNPHSLIAARLVSRSAQHPWGRSLIRHRLNVALALRERLFAEPFYRCVYAESDGLPGLVVDRFDDILVVQITTAGMECFKEDVVEALQGLLRPRVIVFRNDSPIRMLEGLERYVETAQGTPPETLEVREHGLNFHAPLLSGQKTGWFFDQADNRRDLERWVKDARVLDLFSYVGGWGVQAAVRGAAHVLSIDESATATAYVRENAEINAVAERVEAKTLNAFEALKQLRDEQQQFDVIVVDPPALIKRKKDYAKGVQAYERLNELAMKLLARDGILISCSCSQHLPRAELVGLLNRRARHLDRSLQILSQRFQSVDHPIHPAMPETDYLKVIFTRVFR